MCENRELKRIFGPKRDEITEEWGELHNEELNELYSSLNIVWVMGGACNTYGFRIGK